jgi:hypothetical protein
MPGEPTLVLDLVRQRAPGGARHRLGRGIGFGETTSGHHVGVNACGGRAG